MLRALVLSVLVATSAALVGPASAPRGLAARNGADRFHRQRTVVKSSPLGSPSLAPSPTKKNGTEKRQSKGDHELLLFDDPVNTREYVSRILCTKCALTEDAAFEVMMQAHTTGIGVVGTYNFEVAENYCEVLKANGLSSEVRPVKDEEM